jgi:hypothetical protein
LRQKTAMQFLHDTLLPVSQFREIRIAMGLVIISRMGMFEILENDVLCKMQFLGNKTRCER